MRRPDPTVAAWHFRYEPLPTSAGDDDGGPVDVVVATRHAATETALRRALAQVLPELQVEPVVARDPLWWTRVTSPIARPRAAVRAALDEAGIEVRYVASAARPSVRLGPALAMAHARAAEPRGWRARSAGSRTLEPATGGRWFLRAAEGGVGVERAHTGSGAGTRIAVIDDDALTAEMLGLDAEVLVGVSEAPRVHTHGALMVAWATAARATGFRGVAPEASARLYVVPKPGIDVVSLPAAIVRAADDGADVIVAATYVEGTTSPMLDDALAFATRLGRRGRGTAVVLPTGREARSPEGALHASLSLGFGEPASDGRVFCVGPSARGTPGWFLWRDLKGRARPFANRGPAVRWLAPGADLAYPFDVPSGGGERLYHAESSGASAVAAGVLLLVLAQNPSLRLPDLEAAVTSTATVVSPAIPLELRDVVNPAETAPSALDADGHNAKHGYGLMHAGRACLVASCPVAGALVAIGEVDRAHRWIVLAAEDPRLHAVVSPRLRRWMARATLRDPSLAHRLRAVVRHLRLVDAAAGAHTHGAGVVARELAVWLTDLEAARPRPSPRLRRELQHLAERARADLDELDAACLLLAQETAVARTTTTDAPPPTLREAPQ